ncbi:MAG TPA: AAA family ATPase [Pyrinomonadaceae bacterium]|nr:AAA family ATPase [Pyrinomonadaceae bacterium]
MTFDFIIPQPSGSPLNISIRVGETLFVLGANGTGKSNLMQRLYGNYPDNARRISAHRQTWFDSNGITLSSEQRRSRETDIRNWDVQSQSRWRDSFSSYRPNIALYDLVDAENVRSRSIAGAVDADDIHLAQTLSKHDAPIKVINELLQLSNIPIQISVQRNDLVVASKSRGTPYSIAQLSDGERNALLVAAEVLTAKPETLILIDEPERHLHRSIISPLLTLLFEKRRDCAFVVSTHEVMLPLDNPPGRTLLLRECIYSGNDVSAWEADLLGPDAKVQDEVRRDILGGRRKLLFVEGTEQSLDKPLYSLVFPSVSVIPKSSCRDVENAVVGIRGASDLHWLHAFGIVDNDRRSQSDIDALRAKGVYALSVFSVESIYYHPDVERRVVERHASVTGEDASERLTNAKNAALSAITPQVQRLSERTVEKVVRDQILSRLPGQPEIAAGTTIEVSIDLPGIVAAERSRLQDSIDNGNLSEIFERYPVRETSALTDIARKLGFQSREQYEGTVRKLLMDDQETIELVKSFFGTLPSDIDLP